MTNIDVNKLIPHPDNPRKNLGDLTELADSIRENGIFQNLTVVPNVSGTTYTVIIGHRRLAAAKLAGAETVPCAIVKMDYKTQLSTMLLENMQRSDLTPYEQAQGIQMMFDLGESVSSICKKTGFAETTVRKRLKIATLPEEAVKAAQERRATLEDFVRISEVQSEENRAHLLNVVGTNNFDIAYNRILTEEKRAQKMELLSEFLEWLEAEKVTSGTHWNNSYEVVQKIIIEDYEQGDLSTFEPEDGVGYYFEECYGVLYIMKKAAPKKETKPEKTKKQMKVEHLNKQLEQITRDHLELRRAFMAQYNAKPEHADIIYNQLIRGALGRMGYKPENWTAFRMATGLKEEHPNYDQRAEALVNSGKTQLTVLAVIAYCDMNDGNYNRYFDHGYGETAPEYNEDADLDCVYDYLKAIGYCMSDEEKAMQDGTHELFDTDDFSELADDWADFEEGLEDEV